ncbi:hypothetical protein JYU34_007167 [Plutella xylostella]|uniref:Metallothionein n=1 Tax=Plutella xylostella TaxID=51655 RepID=A0ABQ7QPR6_PLUXY|nr:hypothetical protein JYU34_007167 [Plutella xylostella]
MTSSTLVPLSHCESRALCPSPPASCPSPCTCASCSAGATCAETACALRRDALCDPFVA